MFSRFCGDTIPGVCRHSTGMVVVVRFRAKFTPEVPLPFTLSHPNLVSFGQNAAGKKDHSVYTISCDTML